jgi:hypothetical protein
MTGPTRGHAGQGTKISTLTIFTVISLPVGAV